jgi:hypothetical protein
MHGALISKGNAIKIQGLYECMHANVRTRSICAPNATPGQMVSKNPSKSITWLAATCKSGNRC